MSRLLYLACPLTMLGYLGGLFFLKLLEDKILSDGIILNGDILKIDNFLNHQIDVELLDQMGQEFKKLYSDSKINKILTI